MTERWKAYITQGVEVAGGPTAFALTQWAFLFPVFLAIRRAVPSGGRVLDVGCGAGVFTALLGHHGFSVVGIDEDPDIAARAGEMVNYFRSPARIERGGALDPLSAPRTVRSRLLVGRARAFRAGGYRRIDPGTGTLWAVRLGRGAHALHSLRRVGDGRAI